MYKPKRFPLDLVFYIAECSLMIKILMESNKMLGNDFFCVLFIQLKKIFNTFL